MKHRPIIPYYFIHHQRSVADSDRNSNYTVFATREMTTNSMFLFIDCVENEVDGSIHDQLHLDQF